MTKSKALEVDYEKISLTPSTRKLIQMRAGKGPGMLTSEEIVLLRKSKKEISNVCQKLYESEKSQKNE